MTRPIRVEYAGAVYHGMARGNDRREVFREDRDRRRFLETLGEAVEQCGLRVYACCPGAGEGKLRVGGGAVEADRGGGAAELDRELRARLEALREDALCKV
jgi:hypothetical protein